jgi:hypothetical protein
MQYTEMWNFDQSISWFAAASGGEIWSASARRSMITIDCAGGAEFVSHHPKRLVFEFGAISVGAHANCGVNRGAVRTFGVNSNQRIETPR